MNNKIKKIAKIAIVATIYIILTVFNPLSYDTVQLRLSEVLMFLIAFRKEYSISLIIGCFISNLFSSFVLFDILFGTIATALSSFMFSKIKNIYIPALLCSIINGLFVGAELFIVLKTPFLLNFGLVFIGESIVMILGFIIYNILKKNESFKIMISL